MQKIAWLFRFKQFLTQTRRVFLFFGVWTLLLLFPQTANSQELATLKISLDFHNASIQEAFAAIQKQSAVKFIYGEDVSKYAAVKVTIQEANISVKAAIEKVLSNTNLRYTQKGSHVLIDEKPAPAPPAKPAPPGQGSGKLRGRVVETDTSEPLPGATVKIADTKLVAMTDLDGYYTFPTVPAGNYTLEVSFISFIPERVSIHIIANRSNTQDVKMSADTKQLNEIVVSGIRRTRGSVPHTTERLVLQEIKSLQIVASGISSEQISRSADRNAAQAVQRVSGVSIVDDKFIVIRGLNARYGFTYLNDNVAPSTEIYSRAFALDLIPSRVIDKILIFKSPSPENQADATGGVVKIYTKDAKAVRHFDINLQVAYRTGSTNNPDFLAYKGGKVDFLAFDDGARALPAALPGYGNLRVANLKPSEYVEAFSPILTFGKRRALPNMQLTVNYYDAFPLFGKYLTSLTSLNYKNERSHANVYRQQGIGDNYDVSDKITYDNKNTETAQFNLLQNFSFNLNDSSKIQFKNFILQQGISTALARQSHPNRTNYARREKDNILLYNQRFLYSGNLGGTHYLANGKQMLRWNGGFVRSAMERPDQRVSRFETLTPTLNTIFGDPELQWISRGRYGGSVELGDPRQIQLGMISRVWSRLVENAYSFSADYKWKPTAWSSIGLGTYHSWRERRYDRRVYTVNEGDLKNKYSDYATRPGAYGQYVDPILTRFNEMALPRLWTTYYFRDDLSGLKIIDRTAGTDTYVGTEQNNSAYLMGSLSFFQQKLHLAGGVRYEYNRQKIGGALPRDITSPISLNIPILVDNTTKHWLPSLNLTWKPTDSWIVRASYGETVNRFEFREAAPLTELDYESNHNIQGNPALQTTAVKNWDFRLEFYPAGGNGADLVSAGIFYKALDKPIERILNAPRISEVFPSFTYVNANSATIQGLELELRKSLDFIPLPFFKNLSVNANLSLIKSNAKRDSTLFLNGREYNPANRIAYDRTLQGQAPVIVNAGLYYENPGIGAKLSLMYNMVGTRLYAAGMPYQHNTLINASTQRGSIFELQRHQLDFSYTQRVGKGLQMKLGIQNLLNKPVEMAEDANFSYKYEPEKAAVNEAGETIKEGDNIYSSYNPGRYFSLSISYSF